MADAIRGFPDINGYVRNLTYLTSYYKDRGYVFLQLRHPLIEDYEKRIQTVTPSYADGGMRRSV